jgi:hypothetical protein
LDELGYLQIIGTLVSLFIALSSFYFARKKDAVTDTKELYDKLDKIRDDCMGKAQAMEVKLAALEAKYNTMFDVILNKFPKLLVAPHTAQLDALMKKGMDEGWDLRPDEAHLLDELIMKEMTVLGISTKKKVSLQTSAKIAAFAMVKQAVKERRTQAKC